MPDRPMPSGEWTRYARKFLVALAGAAAQALAAGLIPPPYASWVQVGLAVLTALGVYGVTNTSRSPRPDESVADEDAMHDGDTEPGDLAGPDVYREHEPDEGSYVPRHAESVEVWSDDSTSALPDEATAMRLLAMVEDADDVTPDGSEPGLVVTEVSEAALALAGGVTRHGFTSPAPRGTAARVIDLAKSQVGYREGRDRSGWNNDQKYSKEQAPLRWSNRMAWCATFVCWCFWKVTGSYDILLGHTAAVAVFRDRAKAAGRFSEYPAVGAVMILGPSGVHTGIVYAYDDHYIYTIEGNTNENGSREGNGVYLKRRERRKVYGYLYPKFPEGIASADPRWGNAVKPTAVPTPVPSSEFGWWSRKLGHHVDAGNYGPVSVAEFNRALAAGKAGADGQRHGAEREVWAVEQALDRIDLLAPERASDKSAGTSTQQGLDRYRDERFPGWPLEDRRGSAGKASLNQLMHDAGIRATWS